MAESPKKTTTATVKVSASQKERYVAPRVTITPKKARPGRDTEGGLTEAQRTAVLNAEDSIKGNKFETAIIVSPNGEEVARVRGKANHVEMDDIWAAAPPSALKDAVLTHNHPGNMQRKVKHLVRLKIRRTP